MSKIVTGPPETKVALPAAVGIVVSFVLATIQFYVPSFHSPPPALVTMGLTAISLVVGYLAPHTTIPLETVVPPAANLSLNVKADKVQITSGSGGGVA